MQSSSTGFIGLLTAVTVLLLCPTHGLAAEPADDENPFNTPELQVPPPDEAVLNFVDSRTIQSLNGTWNLIVDPMDMGAPGSIFGGWATTRTPVDEWQLLEYSYPAARKVRVPGDFNTQFDDLFFYRDSVWYQRSVDTAIKPGSRYHLWFGGANYTTTVFLNGVPVGRQIGGYVPFAIDVTEHLRAGANDLVINVNNRLGEHSVPTQRTDWWPYGGLTRDVMLVETPQAYIVNAKATLSRDRKGIHVVLYTRGLAAGSPVAVSIPELAVGQQEQVDAEGRAVFQISAAPELWSPASPRLYDVQYQAGDDVLVDRVGFRTIETKGQSVLLNGEPIRFRGISTHEEPIGRDGAAYSRADMERLFGEAKALGANFVRAAHYPYSRHAARVADEMGLLLWAEVPIYWNIAWQNPDTLAVARDQLERLVTRDWSRASVVIWSVANETPYSSARMRFLEQLIDWLRSAEDSRLISAALLGDTRRELSAVALHLAAYGVDNPEATARERAIFAAVLERAGEAAPAIGSSFDLVIDDPLGALVDIVSYNQYFGWYYARGLAPALGVSERTVRKLMLSFMGHIRISSAFDKPLHISEFGAGAKAGRRGEGVWTEDYQADVYRAQLAMLANSPQVVGMTPWILKDFRAMLRPLEGVQDYRNRKGLVDENGRRKQAFFVLRDFYAGPWGSNRPEVESD